MNTAFTILLTAVITFFFTLFICCASISEFKTITKYVVIEKEYVIQGQ